MMADHDPLLDNPDNARQLFQTFSQMSHGFSSLDVVNAAFNVVVNAIRQSASTRRAASEMWDELAARSKGLLMDGYDSTGRLIRPTFRMRHAGLMRFVVSR